MTTTTPSLDALRERLDIPTVQLGRWEREVLFGLVCRLGHRLECELWGHKMGWDIPIYPSPEWDEMHEAWLNSEED